MNEEEQKEFNEAALKLAEFVTRSHNGESFKWDDPLSLVEAIEKYRPKPERVEGWVNLGGDGGWDVFDSAELAAKYGGGENIVRTAVHVREVVPVERKKWRADGEWIYTGEGSFRCSNDVAASVACKIHNEVMERVTK